MTDHSDLIQRLRDFTFHWIDLPLTAPLIEKDRGLTTGCVIGATGEAADVIEAQAARIAELVAAQANAERRGAAQMRDAVVGVLQRGISRCQMLREDFAKIVRENVLSEVKRLPLPPAPQEGE